MVARTFLLIGQIIAADRSKPVCEQLSRFFAQKLAPTRPDLAECFGLPQAWEYSSGAESEPADIWSKLYGEYLFDDEAPYPAGWVLTESLHHLLEGYDLDLEKMHELYEAMLNAVEAALTPE